MSDTIRLVIREDAQSEFILKAPEEQVTLLAGPSLTGFTSLKGPKGDTGPQIKGISIFCSGRPVSEEIIGGGLAPYDFIIDIAESIAKAKVAATATSTITIKNENVIIGNIVFNSGSFDGIVTITSPNITKGEYITFHAPINADSTLGDIGIILKQ